VDVLDALLVELYGELARGQLRCLHRQIDDPGLPSSGMRFQTRSGRDGLSPSASGPTT
jgi:hypothetical protein